MDHDLSNAYLVVTAVLTLLVGVPMLLAGHLEGLLAGVGACIFGFGLIRLLEMFD